MTALLLVVALAHGASGFPDKPAENFWIVDQAHILDDAAEKRINEIAFGLWRDERVPIYVVTINELRTYTAGRAPIETYAHELFDDWGIGSSERNFGMLLLVAVKDRKARIELGAGYGRHYDREAETVMHEQIVPRFKEELYGEGVVAGVEGMDAIARFLALPSPYMPRWKVALWALSILLAIGVGISLIRNGQTGWGWALLVFAAGLLFFLIKAIGSTSASSRSSSGGFGGGSSGGGGATGSW